ncbi:MAG: hypothetical protein J1F68_04800 [Clostridiales bacterium]|nr:hypothetical protein [Clostridiales bacterium]
MERIFYRKSTAAIFVAAILILVLLLCMLLVTLTQMSSLNARAKEMAELIQEARNDETKLQELLEYMQTNDYVRKWAEAHERISEDDISWVEKKLSQN